MEQFDSKQFDSKFKTSQYPVIAQLQGGLVVSCQAPPESPLHDPTVIAAIAQASVDQGAVAVRIDTPSHIRAVHQQISAPIIGLWKRQIDGYEIYITPKLDHAVSVANAGADIIAVDATQRLRPESETLQFLIEQIHKQLNKPVMADVDSLDAAIAAEKAGADLIGTTLYGYTKATRNQTPPNFDLLSQMVKKLSVPVVCEGGISSPDMAKQALDLGAYTVVVGTAITGIETLVHKYSQILKGEE